MADSREPLVLGIDTASMVSVGLARGSIVLARDVVPDPRAHVERLSPLIARVCADARIRTADLDRIVVGLGPGPFTGLRVGIITAQVLAAATGAQLRGVCSLDVIAAAEPNGGTEFLVATDARRHEVYWARYDAGGRRLDGPHVSAPTGLPQLPTIGPAVDLYPDSLNGRDGPRSLDPGLLAALGWQLPEAGRRPLYLRRPDAAESTRRKSVLAGSVRRRPSPGDRRVHDV